MAEFIYDQTIAKDGKPLVQHANGSVVCVSVWTGRWYDLLGGNSLLGGQPTAQFRATLVACSNADVGLGFGCVSTGYLFADGTIGIPSITQAEIDAACVPVVEPPLDQPDEPPDQPPIPPEIPPGLSDDCCSKLDTGLAAIAAAIRDLRLTAEVTVNQSCDKIGECIGGIIDSAGNCVIESAKTCRECCEDIKRGIEFSASDAAICSDCVCDDIASECSQASGMADGDSCTTCGQSPCCCKDNTCEPCDEPDSSLGFVGYCNKRTGNVTVRKRGDPPPQPASEWQQVAFAETEVQALSDANNACQPDSTKPPVSPMPQSTGSVDRSQCSMSELRTGEALSAYLSSIDSAVSQSYFLDVVRSVNDGLQGQYSNIPIIGPILGGLRTDSDGKLATLEQFAPFIKSLLACQSDAAGPLLKGMTALGLYQSWSGAPLLQFADEITYAYNSQCRRKFLDPDKAIAAWLANSIDDGLLDKHWAIAGFCSDALDAYKVAAQSKPVPLELIQMNWRGLISDSEYVEGMQRLGYKSLKTIKDLQERQRPLPTLSDIVRFMVRDADDESLVKRFGLDAYFTDKYQKQLKEWSDNQGIDQTIAKYAWRSHWQIPSPGQLFEFWRRLRHRDGFGGPDKVLEDIKAALIQQDILPYWHEHYLAVSHPPLTRVDVRRAYNIGEFTEQQVYDAHIDLGYSDVNAAALTKFASRLRFIGLLDHRFIRKWVQGKLTGNQCKQKLLDWGYPGELIDSAMVEGSREFDKSPEAKAFVRGEISADKFSEILLADGVTQAVVSMLLGNLSYQVTHRETLTLYDAGTLSFGEALRRLTLFGVAEARAITQLNQIDAQIDAHGAQRCLRSINIRTRRGEITADQAEVLYQQSGITAERAVKLAGWLRCEQAVSSKQIPAAKLCELFGQGILNGAEFSDRLGKIGYDEHDRGILLTDCAARLNVRAQAKAMKDAQEQAAMEAKQRALAEKAAKQIQRDADRLQRQREKNAKVRLGREKQALSAADKIVKKCGCDVATAIQYVKDGQTRLPREYGLSIDETLQVLLTASEAWDGESFDNLTDIVNANAQLIVDSALSGEPSTLNGSANSNGAT